MQLVVGREAVIVTAASRKKQNPVRKSSPLEALSKRLTSSGVTLLGVGQWRLRVSPGHSKNKNHHE
jgi:hypothetical protein